MVPRVAGSNTWLVGPGSHRKILESEPWSAKQKQHQKQKRWGRGKATPTPHPRAEVCLTTSISSYKAQIGHKETPLARPAASRAVH
jgi:hypothetical protein